MTKIVKTSWDSIKIDSSFIDFRHICYVNSYYNKDEEFGVKFFWPSYMGGTTFYKLTEEEQKEIIHHYQIYLRTRNN